MTMMTSASWARVRTLLFKEWCEMRENKTLIGTAIGMPLLMAGSAIAMLIMAANAKPKSNGGDEWKMLLGDRAELFSDGAQAMQVYMGEMGLMLILLLPAVVPPLLAATTIVREKQSRSIEALLVTPVTTWELVLSKLIFCTVVGVVPTYLSILAYYAVAALKLSAFAFSMLATPAWIIVVVLLGPLLGVCAGGFAIAISARVKEVQNAQQLATMVCMPLLGVMALQGSGLATLSTSGALVGAALLILVDALVLAMSVSLFERETILTRWK